MTVVASTPADALEASQVIGDGVEVIEIALDDSWVRDNGPARCWAAEGAWIPLRCSVST